MIELEKIKTYVVNLLEFKGVCKECEKEQPVWQLLYHLYVAVAIMEKLSESDRKLVKVMQKQLNEQFRYVYANMKLKKRKEKDEKEKISPTTPLIKEKEEKEKEQESSLSYAKRFSAVSKDLKYREKIFKQECLSTARKEKYGEKVCWAFYEYWREKSTRRRKMRFELETTWDIDIRLEKWIEMPFETKEEVAKKELENAKRKQAKEADTLQQQQAIIAEREHSNARLEREIAERKQGAVSYEEYLKMKKNKEKDYTKGTVPFV